MSKHTPGPWVYDEPSVFADLNGETEPCRICTMADWLPEHWDEQRANARLIAAAPELLEALRLARKELAILPASLGYVFDHLRVIDAAIAKATGETA